jgi:hypothetical protein
VGGISRLIARSHPELIWVEFRGGPRDLTCLASARKKNMVVEISIPSGVGFYGRYVVGTIRASNLVLFSLRLLRGKIRLKGLDLSQLLTRPCLLRGLTHMPFPFPFDDSGRLFYLCFRGRLTFRPNLGPRMDAL